MPRTSGRAAAASTDRGSTSRRRMRSASVLCTGVSCRKAWARRSLVGEHRSVARREHDLRGLAIRRAQGLRAAAAPVQLAQHVSRHSCLDGLLARLRRHHQHAAEPHRARGRWQRDQGGDRQAAPAARDGCAPAQRRRPPRLPPRTATRVWPRRACRRSESPTTATAGGCACGPAAPPRAAGRGRRSVDSSWLADRPLDRRAAGPARVQDPDAIEIERRRVAGLLRGQLVGEVRQPPPRLRPRPR